MPEGRRAAAPLRGTGQAPWFPLRPKFSIMTIEKLNDNQIRFVLTAEDLEQRNISLTEFAYGTPKAKALFAEMMKQARELYDFKNDSGALMIEAIPMGRNTLVVLVTLVQDPEELDARYSQFGPEVDHGDLTGKSSSRSQDVVSDIVDSIRRHAGQKTSGAAPHTGSQIMQDLAKMREFAMLNRLYSFRAISDAVRAASSAGSGYTGQSKLFLDETDHTYYLYLHMDTLEQVSEMQSILAVLSEYGAIESTPFARCEQLEEHDKVIFDHDAMQSLAAVGEQIRKS